MQWLEQDHVREFWDNSQEHKDDIRIFAEGRLQASSYFDGVFDYWIGSHDAEQFCLLMTSRLASDDELPALWKQQLSKTGKTISIDFCIGDVRFLGKGLAAETLNRFIEFFRSNIESVSDTFFIDPDATNTKAQHVYAKAGFKPVGRYVMPSGVFNGHETLLMIRQF